MNAGRRKYKSASCRIAIPEALPDEMKDTVREVVSVSSEAKRTGQATALMHQITAEADFAWITLLIHVEPFGDGMTDEQLERFYSKFGFARIQDEPLLMARSPEKPRLARHH